MSGCLPPQPPRHCLGFISYCCPGEPTPPDTCFCLAGKAPRKWQATTSFASPSQVSPRGQALESIENLDQKYSQRIWSSHPAALAAAAAGLPLPQTPLASLPGSRVGNSSGLCALTPYDHAGQICFECVKGGLAGDGVDRAAAGAGRLLVRAAFHRWAASGVLL